MAFLGEILGLFASCSLVKLPEYDIFGACL